VWWVIKVLASLERLSDRCRELKEGEMMAEGEAEGGEGYEEWGWGDWGDWGDAIYGGEGGRVVKEESEGGGVLDMSFKQSSSNLIPCMRLRNICRRYASISCEVHGTEWMMRICYGYGKSG
jgi:hypothetical protein